MGIKQKAHEGTPDIPCRKEEEFRDSDQSAVYHALIRPKSFSTDSSAGAGDLYVMKEAMMFEDERIAKKISDLMLEFGARLDESVELVKENCGEVELRTYRTAVSAILVEMRFEVMSPLYKRHPGLKPRG